MEVQNIVGLLEITRKQQQLSVLLICSYFNYENITKNAQESYETVRRVLKILGKSWEFLITEHTRN